MLRKQHGFSLIELLTVIAIIGVLAAFIFPAITGARDNAKKTQCTNNMHQIWTALKQFQQNEGRYPAFIACPYDSATPDIKDISGMVNGRAESLYPEYIKSETVLYCPMAVKNGMGTEFSRTMIIDDPLPSLSTPPSGLRGQAQDPFKLYLYSTYDVQIPRNRPMNKPEAHYTTIWVDFPLATAPPHYIRQLRWKLPPEDTVVTWCSYHRDARRGEVKPGTSDLVLFLDGHVKPMISSKLYAKPGITPPQDDLTTETWWDVWKNAKR